MDSKMKVLLVEDDKAMCDAFEFCISKNEKFHLVATTKRQKEGLEWLQKENIDVLILDLELTQGDGISFMTELNQMDKENPLVIVITNTRSERVFEYLRASGVDFICQKNNESYSPHHVLGIIEQIYPFRMKKITPEMQVISYYQSKEEQYKRARIEEELMNMGFTIDKKATSYLVEAIYILSTVKQTKKLEMKEIYEMVGKVYNTKAVNVEKGIRDNIERVWGRISQKQIDRYYPFFISKEKGTPTNKEFILNITKRIWM